MKQHRIFRWLWIAANALLVASALLLAYGVGWEISTRRYLHGFSDAIVPLSASPEQKVEAILAWMKRGPARLAASDVHGLTLRDPGTTLGYTRLLEVCGTATNAFVNLAISSGVPSRRLLLLDANRQTYHVVAEVRLEDRWVVVDPAMRLIFRDAQGHPLTRQQLTDPRLLTEAKQVAGGYPGQYNFERTAHVRLGRIPYVGKLLRRLLNKLFPTWDEALNWTLVVERSSFAFLLGAALLLTFSLLVRFAFRCYGGRRLGLAWVSLPQQLFQAGVALFSHPR